MLLTTGTMNDLFWVRLIFATASGSALHFSDKVMFATLGDGVTLPCAVSSESPCSSVTWTIVDSSSPHISAGRVMAPKATLLPDCSLRISNIVNDDAKTYNCSNGTSISTVDLLILNITEKVNATQGKVELHCFLNNFKGLVQHCNISGLLLSWLAEDNSVVREDPKRFQFDRITHCFYKLRIQYKLTDHHRKWGCQVSLNGSAKAIVSYITTVENGIEEMFAAVGESVSLACTSSLVLTGKGQNTTFSPYTDSSAIIKNVSPQHARDYQCIDKDKINRIRLHTFDITSEVDPRGENVMLMCILNCANSMCDKDFSVTWSNYVEYSSSSNKSGSLINKVSIPLKELDYGKTVCSVLREGIQVVTKTWQQNNSLASLEWIALPIALLGIAATGVFCVFRKWKRNKDPGTFENPQGLIEMTNVYEDVKNYEPQCKREAVSSNDSFYNLLQAVN